MNCSLCGEKKLPVGVCCDELTNELETVDPHPEPVDHGGWEDH